MFAVPVLLLAFDRTVTGVPTAVVHCFRLTVVALKQTTSRHSLVVLCSNRPVYIHIQHWEQSEKNLFSTERVNLYIIFKLITFIFK